MPRAARPRRILFVCMGNICRSPAAEAVLRRSADEGGLRGQLEVSSAGTLGYHAGSPADPRMRRAAAQRGYELNSRARRVELSDFHRFDLIVALDRDNLAELEDLDPGDGARLYLLSDFLPAGSPRDVPDPYYGGEEGFEKVLDLLEAACPALLEELAGLPSPLRLKTEPPP